MLLRCQILNVRSRIVGTNRSKACTVVIHNIINEFTCLWKRHKWIPDRIKTICAISVKLSRINLSPSSFKLPNFIKFRSKGVVPHICEMKVVISYICEMYSCLYHFNLSFLHSRVNYCPGTPMLTYDGSLVLYKTEVSSHNFLIINFLEK
jgi:hypothetical protein